MLHLCKHLCHFSTHAFPIFIQLHFLLQAEESPPLLAIRTYEGLHWSHFTDSEAHVINFHVI